MDLEGVEFKTDNGRFRFCFDPLVLTNQNGLRVPKIKLKQLQVLEVIIRQTLTGKARGLDLVVVPRTDILDNAWTMDEKANSLDAHISHLRKALGECIETHRGVGYSFTPELRPWRGRTEAVPITSPPSAESRVVVPSAGVEGRYNSSAGRADRTSGRADAGAHSKPSGQLRTRPSSGQHYRGWLGATQTVARFKSWLTANPRVLWILYLVAPAIAAWCISEAATVPIAPLLGGGLLCSAGIGWLARHPAALRHHAIFTFFLVQSTVFLALASYTAWWLFVAAKPTRQLVIAVARPVGGAPQDREAILNALQTLSANNPSIRIMPLARQIALERLSSEAVPRDADVLIRQFIAGRQTRILVNWRRPACEACSQPAEDRRTISLNSTEPFEFADQLATATADTAKLIGAIGLLFTERRNFEPGIRLLSDLIASKNAAQDSRQLGQLFYLRSAAYQLAKQESRAAADIERAAELRPSDCGILISAAMIPHAEAARGEAYTEEAIKVCKPQSPSLASFGDVEKGQILSGLSLALQGRLRYQQAKEVALEAYKLAPTSQVVINNVGVAHNFVGEYDFAGTLFEKAVRLWPRDPFARNNRAAEMYRKGHRARALIDLSIALCILPEYDVARLSRARIVFELADRSSQGLVTRLAAPTLIKFTLYDAERLPDSPQSLAAERAYIKASCYLGMKEYKESVNWAKKAIDKEVVSVPPTAYLVLARAEQRLGNRHEYICALRKGVRVQQMLNYISTAGLVGKTVPGPLLDKMVSGVTDTGQVENEIAAAEAQTGRQYCPDEDRTLAPFYKPFEK